MVSLTLVVAFRFYVQLPTESSHEFHNEMVAELAALEALPTTRLHPKIACKVRELVAAGETRLYAIRKYLRCDGLPLGLTWV